MNVPRYRLWTTVAAALLFNVASLHAQVVRLPTVMPPSDPYPGQVVSHPTSSVELPQAIPDFAEGKDEENPDLPPDARDGVFQKLIFDSTWLASGGDSGFGIVELELETLLGFPCPTRRSPLRVTPGFTVHYLDAPVGADLPPRLYESTVEFRWWKRFTPQFGMDFGLTTGVFSDFEQSTDEAFRTPGHIVAMYEWTPTTKFALGVAYLDRDDVNVLPVGGVVWAPNDDFKLKLVFPRPQILRRLYWHGPPTEKVEVWAYLYGDFGGDTWAIRRATGANDVLTYRDFRLILGLERKALAGMDARLEVGYVFGREIRYASGIPDIEPSDTVMVSAGLTY